MQNKCWLGALLSVVSLTTFAQTYQCEVLDGDVFFTSRPLDGCQKIRVGAANTLHANDHVGAIWHVPTQKIDDDVVIRRPAPKVVPLKITLRNQPKVQPPVTVPKYQAPPPPISAEARQKQVLQKEISQEKASLSKDEAALKSAKLTKKTTVIPRLERNIAERRANLQALQAEYQRLK